MPRAARELAPAGETHSGQQLPFEFSNVDASMDSYRGHTVRLRYVLRVTVSKSVGGFTQEFPLWVQNPCRSLPDEEPIKVCYMTSEVLSSHFLSSFTGYQFVAIPTNSRRVLSEMPCESDSVSASGM